MVTVSFPGLGIGEFSFNKVAFSIGSIEVRWYGIIMVTGIILAFLYAYYRSKQEGISFDDLLDYALITVISGVVGARLYYVITSGQKYTFGEIFAGLSIIGVKYSALLAALIAIFDILPVVGSGLVLVPWAIISLIIGNIGLGVGLFILWAIVCVVRQIIEPKIVGSNVGMHPFLTLFAMLAGNFIYGGIGILLLPITLALCQSLNSSGVVKLYKNVEHEIEEDDPIQQVISKGVDAAGVWITRPIKKRKKLKAIRAIKKKETEEKSQEKGKTDLHNMYK